MRCVFCGENSSNSKSVEHIIPESLGGISHILKPGVVCDKCNNYFAREVEKPFLEHSAIKALRFDEGLTSKKGIIPPIPALLNQHHEVRLWKDTRGEFAGHVDVDPIAFHSIMSSKQSTIIFPMPHESATLTEGLILSRFIGKVAIEGFAHLLIHKSTPEMLNSFVDAELFAPLKKHVRQGIIENWPCSVRRIYDAKKQWGDITGQPYQVVNEFDFLLTDDPEGYFVLALFGMEYAINMAGPSIEGYERWLEEHNFESPLYYGKNNSVHNL